jgi:hypothetical protein
VERKSWLSKRFFLLYLSQTSVVLRFQLQKRPLISGAKPKLFERGRAKAQVRSSPSKLMVDWLGKQLTLNASWECNHERSAEANPYAIRKFGTLHFATHHKGIPTREDAFRFGEALNRG